MSESHLLIALLCIMPIVCFGICAFWRGLELNARESDTRRYPRPGTEPFRPESKIKPFRKHPDMLTKIDDE